jgi:hypothetical protein
MLFHKLFFVSLNFFSAMKNIFAGVKIFWFHSRAIARGRCEHGQARRPFAQVGDVFIDDDVVDDEKFFHHQATIVCINAYIPLNLYQRSCSLMYTSESTER